MTIRFDLLIDRRFLDTADNFVLYEKTVNDALEELETFRQCYTIKEIANDELYKNCLLYTSPSPRD